MKNINRLIILIALFAFQFQQIQTQELYHNDLQLNALISNVEKYHSQSSKEIRGDDNKCGLWISFEVNRNWEIFNQAQKSLLRKILSPIQTQKDTIIGNFHIFYDTTGENEPALLNNFSERIPGTARNYIDSVGYYLNYTWKYFVDSLGYVPPPFQQGETYYKIIIEELGIYQLYGETIFTGDDLYGKFTPPRYTSYIRIDNDFKDLKSEGIAGLKVTCAHELHHAFQLGSYGFLPNDIYFYEITSTWMEDVLYNDVNDYYQYIKTKTGLPKGQFALPDISFTSELPDVTYSRCIWGKFIEKRFSRNAFRFAWEFIRDGEKTLNAIDHSLKLYECNFRKAFLEWTIWNNNTGPKCDTIRYYTEGKQYPKVIVKAPIEYYNSGRSFCDSIECLSSTYHPICLLNSQSDNCNNSAQMMVIVSNLNENGIKNYRYEFVYELSPTSKEGFTLLSNNIYIKLNTPDPENWISQEDIPSVIFDEVLVYPNPLNTRKSSQITFRLPVSSATKATIYIFSASMEKVASEDVDIISPDFEPRIEWNCDNISTGVYFYVITLGSKEYVGKFSIIRD